MKEHDTFPGSVYAVTCKDGCAVTDASGELNMYCEAGGQLHVTAPSDKLYTSADASVRKVNFKHALAALGLLGGGVSELPAGYIKAEFLESSGEQYIDTEWACRANLQIECDYGFSQVKQSTQSTYYVFGARGYGYSWLHAVMLPSLSNVNASFWNAINQSGGSGFIVHDSSGTFGLLKDHEEYIKNRHTVNLSNAGIEITGIYKLRQNFNYDYSSYTEPATLILFGATINGEKRTSFYRCHSYRQEDTTTGEKLYYIPVVDEKGVPCMFDKVTRKPFYNSGTGQFIVGLTMEQARLLGRLSPTGGELTISLPSNWQEDTAVVDAIATAEGKGWVLTIQTYEAEAGAVSTFALRRIWVRKRAEESGSYVAADGSRWQIDWCATMVGGDPQEYGYEPFRSVEAAVECWELQPYVYPEAEQLLTN